MTGLAADLAAAHVGDDGAHELDGLADARDDTVDLGAARLLGLGFQGLDLLDDLGVALGHVA